MRGVRLLGLALLSSFVLAGTATAATVGPIVNPTNGHAYYLLDAGTWDASEAQAVALGGHLATINDQEENDWISENMAMIAPAPGNLWIGLEDFDAPDPKTADSFHWISGDPSTFRKWRSDNPDFLTTEFCTLSVGPGVLPGQGPGTWVNLSCSNVLNAVVEVGAATATTTTTTTTTLPSDEVALTVRKTGGGSGVVTSGPAGIHCGSTCTSGFQKGTGVFLSALPDPGSVFIGWDQAGCSPKRPCLVKRIEEAVTVQATFARKTSVGGKLIYIGICGSKNLSGVDGCIDDHVWFDPSTDPFFDYANPLNDADLDSVALVSGLISIGLRLNAVFPSRSTVLISGSVRADETTFGRTATRVTQAVRAAYEVGDKVYLVGHSSGGAAVDKAARLLKRAGIPITLLAEIDPVFSKLSARCTVPTNVENAFDFSHPVSPVEFCALAVRSTVCARDPAQTTVANFSIADPVGPDSSPTLCPGHRNMDNDRRVWGNIMQFIVTSFGG